MSFKEAVLCKVPAGVLSCLTSGISFFTVSSSLVQSGGGIFEPTQVAGSLALFVLLLKPHFYPASMEFPSSISTGNLI